MKVDAKTVGKVISCAAKVAARGMMTVASDKLTKKGNKCKLWRRVRSFTT